jgi:hypothetical protein
METEKTRVRKLDYLAQKFYTNIGSKVDTIWEHQYKYVVSGRQNLQFRVLLLNSYFEMTGMGFQCFST